MQKRLCKIISTMFLSLILSFLLTNLAFAKNVSTFKPRSITAEPEGMVIEVVNQEEFDALVQDIEEGNIRAQKKWEEAKDKANMESSLTNIVSTTSTSYMSINCTYTFKGDYNIALILRSDVANIQTGTLKKFVTVHEFLVIPHKTSTNISDIYWDYRFLDGDRTCAINTSFIVSIENIWGSYTNYDVTKYVEYYAKGTSLLY